MEKLKDCGIFLLAAVRKPFLIHLIILSLDYQCECGKIIWMPFSNSFPCKVSRLFECMASGESDKLVFKLKINCN